MLDAIAGFCGGACSTLLLHPLDLIKVRFQGIRNNYDNNHLVGACSNLSTVQVIKVASKEGRLYQGLSANLLGNTISWGLYFWIYGMVKQAIANHRYDGNIGSLRSMDFFFASGFSCMYFGHSVLIL